MFPPETPLGEAEDAVPVGDALPPTLSVEEPSVGATLEAPSVGAALEAPSVGAALEAPSVGEAAEGEALEMITLA